jgi:2'-5' RNA ligase
MLRLAHALFLVELLTSAGYYLGIDCRSMRFFKDDFVAKIAVDVVLLPGEEVTNKAIEANRQLPGGDGAIVLNKQDCLPHISLAMGCVDEEDIGQIERILRDIAKDSRIAKLRIIGVYIGTNASGEQVSLYHVEKTEAIQSLHEKVTRSLSRYFSYDVSAEMVSAEGQVAESTLRWIENFVTESSFEKFFPHITIGYGQAEALDFPIEFTPAGLAVCHLGNHCTCKKILVLI